MKIKDFAEILNGYAFKSANYINDGYRVIRITNVQSGYLEDEKPVFYEYNTKLNKYELKDNDILISLTGNVGRCALVTKEFLPAYLNQRVCCLRTNTEKVLPKFLYYILNSKKFEFDCINSSQGIAQLNMSTEWLKEYSLEIPSIEEQRIIIRIFDKVYKNIKTRKNQINHCNNLIKSQFVEMFGDIENTKYKIYELSKLANLITDGEHKKPNYTVAGIPFISVVNITTGELKFENCKFVSEADARKFNKRCNPEKGDILYTKVGATYGRSAIVDTDKKFTLYVSVCLIKPKKNLINPTFLNYTMRQSYVKLQADKSIKGIGVPDLHLIEIKNFKIILPPINLQNKFADIVKQIDKQKFEFENSLKRLEELKNSLMQEYFG